MTPIYSGRLAIPGALAAVMVAMGLALVLETAPQAGASGKNSAFVGGDNFHRPHGDDPHWNTSGISKAQGSDTVLSGAKLTPMRTQNKDFLVERGRGIEAHNREVAAGASAKRQMLADIITAPVVSYQDKRRIILGETPDAKSPGQKPCPNAHNCGYRLYEDGTGPRIIVIGADTSDTGEAYNGMDGPKVITLD